MRPEFDAELATLEGELQEAGTVTVQAIHGALVALQDWEPGVLDYLAGLDDRVDGLYRQIERDVETLIARQAPGRDRPADRARRAADERARRADEPQLRADRPAGRRRSTASTRRPTSSQHLEPALARAAPT